MPIWEEAFLLAGAKAVISEPLGCRRHLHAGSHKHFYRHLADGQDKGSALRQAKIELLGEFGEQALPFYWAGFSVVGDGSRNVPLPARKRHKGKLDKTLQGFLETRGFAGTLPIHP